jgi:hypothetical protein
MVDVQLLFDFSFDVNCEKRQAETQIKRREFEDTIHDYWWKTHVKINRCIIS